MTKIAIIVAVAEDNVIGAGNTIPWYCPADLQYFKRTTLGSPVLMGRKTYQSLKVKPLPGRQNIVVSRDVSLTYKGCDVVTSLKAGLELVKNKEKLFIIGGADIYQQCMNLAEELYITYVDIKVEGDRYFPKMDLAQWSLVKEQRYQADEKNPHNMIFKVFIRR
ncbi:MAG: dihydrofolate reductase [Gammaproteobacteria bacterium]|nr:dihydrofolate reductase [Gammaproteobacteria bacterium]